MPFFPIFDENPRRHIATPLVNWGLILTCVLAFIWQTGLPPEQQWHAIIALGVIPLSLFGGPPLPPEIYAVPPGATLITSMFLHGGFAHLFGNMLYLYIFGDNVEDSMGHGRFFIFYMVCGVAAALCHAVTEPTSVLPMIGASGAISGVLGGYLLLHPRARILVLTPFLIPIRISAWFLLIGWLVLQLLATSSPAAEEEGGVAWLAHIGGFVVGAVLIPFFRRPDVPLFDGRR